jgi:hypothetical protein
LERRFSSCSHDFIFPLLKGQSDEITIFFEDVKNRANPFACALMGFKFFYWVVVIVDHKIVGRILSYLITLSYIFFINPSSLIGRFFSVPNSQGSVKYNKYL